MRTNLAERLGLEPEEETRERRERLMEELRYREAMRRVAKTCCVWLGGAAFVLAVIAGYAEMSGVSDYTRSKLNGLESGYTPSGSVQAAQAYLEQVKASKPGVYQSRWDDELTSLYDQIRNRKKFSYDMGTDPLYQQYREQYQRQGRLAMQDTMGQAAALTGGYGSTYGEQVGQQAYHAYLQNLNDIVPQLQQQAYQRYQDEGTDLYNQYSLVKGREDTDYGRYRDTVSDYYSDLSDARSAYNSEKSADMSQWSTMLDYWAQKANNENL